MDNNLQAVVILLSLLAAVKFFIVSTAERDLQSTPSASFFFISAGVYSHMMCAFRRVVTDGDYF